LGITKEILSKAQSKIITAIMRGVGSYIRHLRETAKYSLHHVAASVNFPAHVIARIENGVQAPTIYQLLQIAAVLQVDEAHLLMHFHKQLVNDFPHHRSPDGRNELLRKGLASLEENIHKVKVFVLETRLREYLESISYYENSNNSARFEKIMPDGMAQLIIDLSEGFESSLLHSAEDSGSFAAIVVGQRDTPAMLPLSPAIKRIVVRFKPQGLFMLTGIPQQYLANRLIEADNIFGPGINLLAERIKACENAQAMYELLKGFFMSRIESVRSNIVGEQVVRFMIENIELPVHRLVDKSGYSQKHLIHLFKSYTGLTPKKFQQVQRFFHAIDDLSLVPSSVGAMPFNDDYFDQAHFIKKFNQFSGFNPGGYLKTGNTCPRMIMVNN
jgi:AraC-like DNA-binding protein/transcriptional regulator with XRE-family HTH domain